MYCLNLERDKSTVREREPKNLCHRNMLICATTYDFMPSLMKYVVSFHRAFINVPLCIYGFAEGSMPTALAPITADQ